MKKGIYVKNFFTKDIALALYRGESRYREYQELFTV